MEFFADGLPRGITFLGKLRQYPGFDSKPSPARNRCRGRACKSAHRDDVGAGLGVSPHVLQVDAPETSITGFRSPEAVRPTASSWQARTSAVVMLSSSTWPLAPVASASSS